MQELFLAVITVSPGMWIPHTASDTTLLDVPHCFAPHAPDVTTKVPPIRRQQEEDNDASNGPKVGSLEHWVVGLEIQNLLMPRG